MRTSWVWLCGMAVRARCRLLAPGGQDGQGLVEYGLILILVAVAVVVALGALGGRLPTLFDLVGNSLHIT